MNRLLLAAGLALLPCSLALAALPQPDSDNGGLTLPPGFRALVVADNLGHLRFITVAGNGDIYAKKSDNGLVALRDTKGTGRADLVQTFGTGAGTGVAARGNHLYYSTNDAVYRYVLTPGQLVPTGDPEPIVIGLPPGQREHESKSFAFDNQNHIYVEIGSPSNSSGKPDRQFGAKGVDPTELLSRHGGIWRFDADKPNQDQVKDGLHFCTGFRHCVSLAWQPVANMLYMVQNGRDQLNTVDPKDYTVKQNSELPAEEMHVIHQGESFGWPFTYWDGLQHKRMLSPEFGGDGKKEGPPGKYADPIVAFPAHWAPLGMTFYTATQFPEHYRNGAFIAFHGSWNRAPEPQEGYRVAFVPFDAEGNPSHAYETFANNFAGIPVIMSPGQAHYRPCGVAVGPDGSLYVTDTEKGRIWRIIYTGENVAAASHA